jgi:mono/diheme cytochrome c family protein
MPRLSLRSRFSVARTALALSGATFLMVTVGTVVRAGQDAAAMPTVWDGIYTEAQAERGEQYFVANCAECHGLALEGGEGSPLSGEEWWDSWRELPVDRLFEFVSTNMPFDDLGELAGTLSNQQYIDIVAHILRTNGFPAGAAELTPESADGVMIIAEDGPGELPNSTLAYVVGCLADVDGDWVLTQGSRAVRAETVDGQPDLPLGDHEYLLEFVLLPLDDYIGYKMSATGLLIGEGGVDGINVSTVDPIGETCQ